MSGPKSAKQRVEVVVEGRTLSLSNLDKPLYPASGARKSGKGESGGGRPFTKAQVIDYYRTIAPVMLPHLHGRAMTLVRFPDGADKPGFFEKNCPDHRPEWVATGAFLARSSGEIVNHCLVEDLPTLIWLANLAALELHAPMATVGDPEHPTAVVFDLDPGPPAATAEACAMALELRSILDRLGLAALPKTSGKKGVHVYLPLNPTGPKKSRPTQQDCQDFARAIADLMARRNPAGVVTTMAKAARGGKVFVDWSQNTRHKTTVAPYSLRAGERPTVSVPLDWDEVESAAEGGDADALRMSPASVLERVHADGDRFREVLELVQELPARGTREPT